LPSFVKGGEFLHLEQPLHNEVLYSLALVSCADLVCFVGRRVLCWKTFLSAKVTA